MWISEELDTSIRADWLTQGDPACGPSVKFLPLKLRRRMSLGVKMSLWVAHQAWQSSGLGPMASVFVSRHGEADTTLRLFQEITDQVTLSPLDFSHSVHNTASGIFSISAGTRRPSTALAASRDLLEVGFLEAGVQCQEQKEPVLLVVGDQKIPHMYSSYVESTQEHGPYAMAFVLEPGAGLRGLLSSIESGAPLEVIAGLRQLQRRN